MKKKLLKLAFRYLWVITQRCMTLFATVMTVLAVVSFCKHLSIMGFVLIIVFAICAAASWNGADMSELRLDISISEMESKLRLPESSEVESKSTEQVNVQLRRESNGTL